VSPHGRGRRSLPRPLPLGLPCNLGPAQYPGVPGAFQSRQWLEPSIIQGAASVAAALHAWLYLPRVSASELLFSTSWSSAAHHIGEHSCAKEAFVGGRGTLGRGSASGQQWCGELPFRGCPCASVLQMEELTFAHSVSSFLGSSRWGRKRHCVELQDKSEPKELLRGI